MSDNDTAIGLVSGTCPYCDLSDRHAIAQDYYAQFVNRLDSMFKWKGLPRTIPENVLERYLKLNGWCGIGEVPATQINSSQLEIEPGLYCFFGGLGATPDEYYRPTEIILANPILGSRSYKIGKDCVWAKNDSLARGISHILSRYSHLLAENDISIHVAQVTSRIPFVFTAETDSEIESAKLFVKQAEEGKIGIVKSSAFNNGVTPRPTGSETSGNYLKALIELHQYLKAQWYNDLGIGAQFNMKRERVNTAETEANSPSLLPLVDEMLKFRKKICKDVNEMFPGQSWSVELDSAWVLENLSQELEVEAMKPDNSSSLEKDGEIDDLQ